jgi:hypothetical protein
MKSAKIPSLAVLVMSGSFLCGTLVSAQTNHSRENQKPTDVAVQRDGTVELPAESVPVSKFLSPEANIYLIQHLHDMRDSNMTYADKGVPRFMAPYLEPVSGELLFRP